MIVKWNGILLIASMQVITKTKRRLAIADVSRCATVLIQIFQHSTDLIIIVVQNYVTLILDISTSNSISASV